MLVKYGDWVWRYIKDASVTTYCIVGTVSLYAFYRLVIKKKYRLPPGPRGLPLIGNIASLQNSDMLEILNEWQKKYGDIMTVNFGPMRTIVISDADLLTEAFVNQSSLISDRPYAYSFDRVSEGCKSISAASYGDTWKYQRKVASQSLRQYLSGNQLAERCHEVILYSSKIVESQNDPFSLKDILSLSIFNILHGLCFESTKELDDPNFKRLYGCFQVLNANTGNGFLEDVFPPLRYWPTKRFSLVLQAFEDILDFVRERIEERKANMDKDNPRCLTDTVLLAQQELKETDSASLAHMTDVHTRQIIVDMFGAGLDTSRATLDWIFLVLIANPDIQTRMQKEIDDVVGQAIPGKEHRSKLVYTEAVILETMRLYGVVPFGVPHLSRTDTSLGGYDIPAKTTIMPNQHLILRDPKYWEDPLEFKPERFMSEDGSKLNAQNRSFIPFSMGPRSCPGESIAKLSIIYIVIGLLQKFSFSLPPGEKANFTPISNLFVYGTQEYKVVVKCR